MEILLRTLHRQRDDQDRERDHDQHGQRHAHADRHHHDEDADDRRERRDQLRDALADALLERVDIVRHAGENFAVGAFLKILHRDPVDLLRDLLPETVADVIGYLRHHKALEEREQRTDPVEDEHGHQNMVDLCEIDRSRSGHFGDQSAEEFRGRLAKDLGPDDGKDRTGDRADKHDDKQKPVAPHILQELSGRASEVFRFLDRTGTAAASSRGASFVLAHALSPPNCNWRSAICLYALQLSISSSWVP